MNVRVRSVGGVVAPGFPFGLALVSLCSLRVPTVHFCAKVYIPFIHSGTGAGAGLKAEFLGLNVRM